MMSKGYIPLNVVALSRVLRDGGDARNCQALALTLLLAASCNQGTGEVWVGNINDIHSIWRLPVSETREVIAAAVELGLIHQRKQDDVWVFTVNPCVISSFKDSSPQYRKNCLVYHGIKTGRVPHRLIKNRRFFNVGKINAVSKAHEKEGRIDTLSADLFMRHMSKESIAELEADFKEETCDFQIQVEECN